MERRTRGRTEHVPGQDRAVSAVIGFVIVFGFVVLAWTTYQGAVIPAENREAEFNHNQQVQGEVLNLRDSLLRAGVTGVQQSTSITVGADYAARTIAINLARSGARIATREPAPSIDNLVTIENVTAIDAETRDYLAGTISVPTKSLVFEPTYARYAEAPDTIIAGGGGAVFNDFDNTNLSRANQVLIKGRTITIVAIAGNLSTARSGEGESITVETTPLSIAENRVTIADNGSGPLTIRLPTRLDDVGLWNDSSLTDNYGADGPITSISRPQAGVIAVTLENKQYTLRMMKVGVGRGTSDPGPAYLTDVSTLSGSVLENSSNRFSLEVRDPFNNPVDGVQVNGSIETAAGGSGEVLSVVGEDDSVTGTTGQVDANSSNGRVTFNYTAPDVGSRSSVKLEFTITDDGITAAKRVWVNTSVLNMNAGGGGGGGEGGGGNNTGPLVESVGVNTSPVNQGDPLNLTATINDTGRGGLDIIDVEWYSNRSTPNGANGTGFGMVATDGEFDQPTEAVHNASINTSGWTIGWHTLSIRGKDGDGLWGPIGNTTLEVTADPLFSSLSVSDASTTNPPGQNGKVEYTVSYTVDDPNNRAKNVSVFFGNGDNPGVNETLTSTTFPSDSITHSPSQQNADHGDSYFIEVTLFDIDGNAVAVRNTTDTADGTDPSI